MSPIQPMAAFVSRLLRITCADAAPLTAMSKAETAKGISQDSYSDIFMWSRQESSRSGRPADRATAGQ